VAVVREARGRGPFRPGPTDGVAVPFSRLSSRSGYDPERHGAKCDECPLRGQHKPVPPKGPPGAGVAIVGEAPGKSEIERGSPFVGQSGLLLRDLLAEAWHLLPRGVARLRYDDFWITNALLCKQPGADMDKYLRDLREQNKKSFATWREASRRARANMDPEPPRPVPTKSPVECCRPRLLAELRGRTVIIPVGKLALSILDEKRRGIVRWRGAPFEWSPQWEG